MLATAEFIVFIVKDEFTVCTQTALIFLALFTYKM